MPQLCACSLPTRPPCPGRLSSQGMVGGVLGALLVLLHNYLLTFRAWAVPRQSRVRRTLEVVVLAAATSAIFFGISYASPCSNLPVAQVKPIGRCPSPGGRTLDWVCAVAACLPLVRLTKALYLATAEHLLEPLQRCGDLLRARLPWGAPVQHGHVPAALVPRRDVQRVRYLVLQAHRPSAVNHDSIRGVEQGGHG